MKSRGQKLILQNKNQNKVASVTNITEENRFRMEIEEKKRMISEFNNNMKTLDAQVNDVLNAIEGSTKYKNTRSNVKKIVRILTNEARKKQSKRNKLKINKAFISAKKMDIELYTIFSFLQNIGLLQNKEKPNKEYLKELIEHLQDRKAVHESKRQFIRMFFVAEPNVSNISHLTRYYNKFSNLIEETSNYMEILNCMFTYQMSNIKNPENNLENDDVFVQFLIYKKFRKFYTILQDINIKFKEQYKQNKKNINRGQIKKKIDNFIEETIDFLYNELIYFLYPLFLYCWITNDQFATILIECIKNFQKLFSSCEQFQDVLVYKDSDTFIENLKHELTNLNIVEQHKLNSSPIRKAIYGPRGMLEESHGAGLSKIVRERQAFKLHLRYR